MTYETLRWAAEDGVVTLTLDRPETRNALDAQMRADLAHALRRAPEAGRAVVITGAGPAFCAGQDLGDADTLRDLDLGRTLREEMRPLLEALDACRIPTLAAVNGAAAGAGLALALAVDVAVASERASFAAPGLRLGLPPDGGLSWLLPRAVGPARARGMALFAEPIGAAQAADWGLIWEAVPEPAFPARVAARARALAAGPTLGQRLTRALMREGQAVDWGAQLEREAEAQSEAGRSRDFLEGAVAHFEGRAARFEGR